MDQLRELLESINTKLDQMLIVLIDSNKVNSIIMHSIEGFVDNVELHSMEDEDDPPWKDSEDDIPPFES